MKIPYATIDKGLAPQQIRMRLPGWAGSPQKKMENGSEPQPWHCKPFVDAATYGLELVYPYETECHVINDGGAVRFEWDYANEPGVKLDGEQFGVFDNTPARFYRFEASVDIEAPPGYVLQTQPHPRFFTDETGTAPLAMIGHVQSEWWSRPAFVVFKVPAPGQRHIFRKGEPYVQILFVPRTADYEPSPMSDEHAHERRERWKQTSVAASYVSTNVWHEPAGGESKNYYKLLARAHENGGMPAMEQVLQQGMERRDVAVPQGKTLVEYLELARQYQREGRYTEAKDIYVRMILRDPQNAEAASRLGILANSMGLPVFALDLLKRAAEMKPDEPAYHANLGEFYRRQGRAREAEASLRAALNISPADPQTMSNLAITLAMQNRFDEAVELSRSAIQTGTRLPVVHLRVAAIFAQVGQTSQSRSCLQTVLSIDPANQHARRQLEALPPEPTVVSAFSGVQGLWSEREAKSNSPDADNRQNPVGRVQPHRFQPLW